jgi:predicted amidophosphoribosyltransferase
MPLHARRQAERGYNQVDVLVQVILSIYPHIRIFTGVARSIYTEHASRLTRQEREGVLGKDIFALQNKKALVGKNVLIVDDVITTGMSFQALVTVLSAAHTNGIYGVFLASGH